MVIYDRGQLGQAAKKSGFVRDTFEKVLRLKEILVYLNADEYLHEHLALKGGTAINMTIFDLPRLSVDLVNISRLGCHRHAFEIHQFM